MLSQDNIDRHTPMGVQLTATGATFRVWAPRARAVYVNGTFAGLARWDPSPDLLMARNGDGYWTGFLAGARDGDPYKFYVVGPGSSGYKRDPYARELSVDAPFPNCNCIIRNGGAYPWCDSRFVTPDFADMIIYQLHIGTYLSALEGRASTFLDVVTRIDYFVALGVNVLQPLPIDECETTPSKGYNGCDYFSPDFPYLVPPTQLGPYLTAINGLRARKGVPALAPAQLVTAPNQLKAMIDTCHLYGIAVVFDVVYNHAGGFDGDDEALYFWDRMPPGDNNDSLYFTDRGWAGGLSFALWNEDVRQFIIDTATYYLDEFHGDGFRYDEISALLSLNGSSGWTFCQDLSSTVRFGHPRALQNAEMWPVKTDVVRGVDQGGAGFDVLQHDGLRDSVRAAIAQCAYGAASPVDMSAIARQLYPPSFDHAWRAVTCVENHDLVKSGDGPRIPTLADGADHRSWYARSRARVATALLLTAPGIPQLFMGQEFLEDKQWSDDPRSDNLIDWPGLDAGDKSMADHLRFTQDAVALRRQHRALRGDQVRVHHAHDNNRVLAFHRWIEGEGDDVIIVASLSDATYYAYAIGFPARGRWVEIFNSDVYDHWVNPQVAGNGGGIVTDGAPMHGFATSASIVIPANGVVVFARDG